VVLIVIGTVRFSQGKIFIKVQGQTFSTTVEADNEEKLVTINGKAGGTFIIYNSSKNEIKNWNRSFMIVDQEDKEVIKFPKSGKSEYKISVSHVLSKLQKNKHYPLYTVALPADPAKASVIRVRRVLVCKLRVK
jgi:hypothetical protein